MSAAEQPKRAKPVTKGYDVPESALLGFDQFWSAYPRKTAKGDAKLAWYQVRATERGLLSVILNALGWQRKQDAWVRDGGQYIPYPATWLRAERWDDAPTIANPGQQERVVDERARTAELLKRRQEVE